MTLAYIDYFYLLITLTSIYILGSNLGDSKIFLMFFFVIIITVQIQHYCLYSDSPTLLPLLKPRPPAPAALRLYFLSFFLDW